VPSYDRALHALRIWLDSWSGIGHVASAWRARATTFNSRATTRREGLASDVARGLDGLEAPGGVEGEASGALCSQDCRAAKRQWNLM